MSTVRQRGAASLEVIGTFPILLLSAMIALQIGVAGWTVIETAEAAQAGARAKSVNADPKTAVRASLGGILEPSGSTRGELTDGGGYRYTVEVEIPSVLPFSLGSVTRIAEMPVSG